MNRMVHVSLFVLGSLVGVSIDSLVGARDTDPVERPAADPSVDIRAEGPASLGLRNDGSEPAARGPEADLEQLAARERELAERRAAVITAALARETVDPDWAPITQRKIADAFAARGPGDARLASVACGASLCMAEVRLARGDFDNFYWLAIPGLSRGYVVHDEATPEGTARSVAYLARVGYTLPK